MTSHLYTVVGASGFVGSRLTASLRDAGHEVFAPARESQELFARPLGRLIYCAGLTADFASRPFDTVQAHVGLLARLLQEGLFEHLVYLSSTRLYDGLGENNGSPASETHSLLLNPNEPRHLYDLSKGLGESLCLSTAGKRASVARLACVYDWQAGSPGFLSTWLQQAMQERQMFIDTASGIVRDYIHLDDVVAALIAMSTQQSTGIVNIATGENISNGELAEIFNGQGWSVKLGRECPLQQRAVCSIERLAALGIQPRPVREVLHNCLTRKEFHAAA